MRKITLIYYESDQVPQNVAKEIGIEYAKGGYLASIAYFRNDYRCFRIYWVNVS